ncbi:MAG TPA: calcium-binding protein [Actinomycetota bacterium]|nr:calcium-binding protein [Actinomycetota bacterium]
MTKRLVSVIAATSVVAWIVLSPGAAGAARPKCKGKRATIVGTNRSERIVGTPRRDVIVAKGGRDVILARNRADLICAGPGNDFVRAGGGNDAVYGQLGADILAGDAGADVIAGAAGAELLYGGDGNDTMRAGTGASSVMYGNRGNDRMFGGDGFDTLLGLEGNDRLHGGPGNFDVASFLFADNPDGVSANIADGTATGEGDDTLVGIESLQGSGGPDVLVGDAQFNVFYPMEGDDSVFGGPGGDLVSFIFAPRAVTADVFFGQATGEGTDSLVSISDFQGSRFGDTLTGDPFENQLFGEAGNDTLSGGASDDLLDGAEGTDTGDGGLPGPEGDRCFSIEHPTNCEITERRGGARQLSVLEELLGRVERLLR